MPRGWTSRRARARGLGTFSGVAEDASPQWPCRAVGRLVEPAQVLEGASNVLGTTAPLDGRLPLGEPGFNLRGDHRSNDAPEEPPEARRQLEGTLPVRSVGARLLWDPKQQIHIRS